MKLPPVDKLLHFSVSANLAMGAGIASGRIVASALVVLAIGAAKELVHDRALGRGTPDAWDMVANTLGVLAGAAVLALST